MKQFEKDQDQQQVSSVVRLDGVLPRRVAAQEPVPKEFQQLSVQFRELERKLESMSEDREALLSEFRALEGAVQGLAVRYAERQHELEQSLCCVAQSVREQFLEFHQFKGEVLGLAAHVNRWTKRIEDLAHMAPLSWARKLKRR